MQSKLLAEPVMNNLGVYWEKRPPTAVTIVAVVLLASIISAKIFGLVSTLLILSALITLHEFGHWILARISGIAVPIFSVGLGSASQVKVMCGLLALSFSSDLFLWVVLSNPMISRLRAPHLLGVPLL